jgi:SPIRAL1-like protein
MARSGYQVTQNVDNFLRDKPSTRLHAPPGGGSSVGSLIYGGGDGSSPFAGHERHTSRRKVENPELANPYAKDNRRGGYNDAPSNFNQAAGAGQQAQPSARAGASSNQYASGSNQNSGNVLTDRRITRIHAPPGGASSIHFG